MQTKTISTLILIIWFSMGFQMTGTQVTPLGLSSQYLARVSGNFDGDVARYRLNLYEKNRQIVIEHNMRPSSYQLELNLFSELSDQEINLYLLTLVPSIQPAVQLAKTISKIPIQSNQLGFMDSPMLAFNTINSNTNANINTNSVNTNRNMVSPSTESLQQEVLNSLKNYLTQRNKTKTQIDTEINQRKLDPKQLKTIPLFTTTIDNNNSNTRLLQSSLNQYDVDWTCISGEIRSQGVCGSCYAIATADCLSAIMGIYHFMFFIPLSIQQLIDCPKNSMTLGCGGGFLQGAFAYMASSGIVAEYKYPYSKLSYENNKEQSCKSFKQSQTRYKITNFNPIAKGNCQLVRLKLKDHPLSIGIAARRLLLYKSGIFNGCLGSDREDHAVVLIGYREGKGWKIKNSWGKMWGERGYAWIADGNNCRVCEMAFTITPLVGSENMVPKNKVKQCPISYTE